MAHVSWGEALLTNLFPLLIVGAVVIAFCCLCGCWGFARSLNRCCTACFETATDGVTTDLQKTQHRQRERARRESAAAPAGAHSGGERDGGECASLLSCLTCCNCCGLCGPPAGVQVALPVGGGGKVAPAEAPAAKAAAAAKAPAAKAAEARRVERGDLSGDPYGPNADELAAVDARVPLLALDRCAIRV
jgi:hypothetical protein